MNLGPSADITFKTAALPEEDRFDAFRGLMACVRDSVSFSAPEPRAFWCEMTIKPVRNVIVWRSYGAPVVATVTSEAARREEILSVQVCVAGGIATDQQRCLNVGAGEGFVSPSTVAGHLSYASHAVVTALVAPRDILKPLVRDAWPDACADLSAAPAFQLLRGWLSAALEPGSPIPPDVAGIYEQTAVDLLALALGVRGDERELVLGRGVGLALRDDILRRLKQKSASPWLNADVIARDLGITSRYVHRLLEETGKTFSEHVLEERLTRAFEMLSDRAAPRRITEVATAVGFTDISYFNRTFRRRFGETPTSVRARVTALRGA